MNDTTTLPRTTVRRPRTWLRLSLMLLVVALLAAGLIGFQQFKAGILKQVVTNIRSALPTVATAKRHSAGVAAEADRGGFGAGVQRRRSGGRDRRRGGSDRFRIGANGRGGNRAAAAAAE